MRNLFATLAYIGADASDVVQVKAFINPIANAKAIEADIASFFRNRNAPPIVTVEWLLEPNRAEIELIAAAPAEPSPTEAVGYYAPTWMNQATTFSRLVDIHRGGLLFTSGLYGQGETDGEEQARHIFKTLTRILEEAGSDYDHLVKATYYPSGEDGRKGLVNVRTAFYNPKRQPAASLIRVKGTGRPGTGLTVDMIGVVPE
jgi:enamine deaminase RidA (YjgF/YER057c/UK114 family)